MKKIFLIFSLMFFLGGTAGAVDVSSVKAYPVPFNPRVDSGLKIVIPDSDPDNFTVTFTVYDINGDLVTKRTFAAASYDGGTLTSFVTWSGRNSRGTVVKAGFYIIKVVIENESSGDYGKKILRILVKR